MKMKNLKITLIVLSSLLLFSCSNTSTEANDNLTSAFDSSESIAVASGEESGGVIDNIGDLAELTADEALSATRGGKPYKSKSWDEENQLWIIEIEKERGGSLAYHYGKFHRIYTLQFLDENNNPLMHRISETDTAYTALFKTVSAEGIFRNKRISHKLNDLNIDWVVSDINTDTLTINGTFYRAGFDSLTTKNHIRTSDHQLEMELLDVRGPRGSRLDISQKVSGEITGTFDAEITFIKGEAYQEKIVHKEFVIDITGGTSTIIVDDETFNYDNESGEPNN